MHVNNPHIPLQPHPQFKASLPPALPSEPPKVKFLSSSSSIQGNKRILHETICTDTPDYVHMQHKHSSKAPAPSLTLRNAGTSWWRK